VSTVSSGEPLDCGNRLRRCNLNGGPFLGVPTFGTGAPTDGAASVENG